MKNKLKTIEVFDCTMKANIALNFLKENGIKAVLLDEFLGDIINIAVKGVKLQVDVQDEAKAKELLNNLDFADFSGEKVGYGNSDVEVIELLQEAEAFLDGHFKLTSGRHSDKYVEKIKIINQPVKVTRLCKKLAERFDDIDFDIVIAPAMGAIVLAYETARLMKKKCAFTQRKDGKMTIRSGFDVTTGMKVLLIEDIVTTGGSIREVIELLNEKKLEIQGIGIIVDRTGGKIDLGYRTETLVSLNIESYAPEECPLCKDNVPLTTPGSSDKA